jgi:hypothetical protein
MSGMREETLFDHAISEPGQAQAPEVPRPPLLCTTPGTDCGCETTDGPSEGSCAFAAWVRAVAQDLALSAPKDADLPEGERDLELDPVRDPLAYLLSKKALGSHYPGEMVALPGFYAFSYDPLDQGVRLLSVLYSRAHDPAGGLSIDHRAGYRAEPGVCRAERFFAAGFIEQGANGAELAYAANHVSIRDLVCWCREDLEALYRRVLECRTR